MSSILLHIDVKADDQTDRIIMSISRSDEGSVLRGLLTPDQAREIAHQLLRAARRADR